MKNLWTRWVEQMRQRRELPARFAALSELYAASCEGKKRLEECLRRQSDRILDLEGRAFPPGDALPGLTAAEVERLALLAEECGEVAQAVCKVLRHGWESQSPYGGKPNRVALEREIGDLRAVVNLMLDARDVDMRELQAWQRRKRDKLGKWTHHQADSMPREAQLEMMRAIEAER